MNCPKCNSNMGRALNEDGKPVMKCIMCGKEILTTAIAEPSKASLIPGPNSHADPPSSAPPRTLVQSVSAPVILGVPVVSSQSSVPPKPKGRLQVHKYYEDNKEPILADYHKDGTKATCERWHIGEIMFLRLLVRWGIARDGKPGMRPCNHLLKPTVLVPTKIDVFHVFKSANLGKAGYVTMEFKNIDFFNLPKVERDWLCQLLDIWEQVPFSDEEKK